MVEFDINSPNNLNPDVNLYKPLPKEKVMEEWSNRPDVKSRNIKAIDTDKSVEVSKGTLNFLKLFAILGIIGIIIIAIGVGVYSYTLYNDGTLLDPVSEMICSPIYVNNSCGNNICPSVPSCPDCPNCINNCDLSVPDEIKIVNGS